MPRRQTLFFGATIFVVMAGTMYGASLKTDREVATVQAEIGGDPKARLRELIIHRDSLVASRIIQQKKLDNVLRRRADLGRQDDVNVEIEGGKVEQVT